MSTTAMDMMQPAHICLQGTELILNETVNVIGTDDFDPKKHLNFKQPEKIYTMTELKLDRGDHVSPVAVSEPFQLFTEEAVERMRQEIFKPEIMTKYQYSSNLAQCQLRGYAAKAAPFIYDTWKDPEVLGIVSKIAGIELVPVLDFEIAHINLSTKSEKQKREELEALEDRKLYEADEGIAGCPWEDDKPIVDWHRDSYPFVCVTMLSDCTNMVGGETALRTGDNNIMKVRGPGKGCSVILQGRYIEHQALRTFGTCERITSVTSFRPKHHSYKDETVLSTVRGISDLPTLYRQYTTYRLDILENRSRDQLKKLREDNRFNTKAIKAWLTEQINFLAHMNEQLVPEELVTKGHIDDCIHSEGANSTENYSATTHSVEVHSADIPSTDVPSTEISSSDVSSDTIHFNDGLTSDCIGGHMNDNLHSIGKIK